MDDIRRIDKPAPPPPPVGGGTASQASRRRREAFRDYLERHGRDERPAEDAPTPPPAAPAEPPESAEPDPERGRHLDERA